MCDIVWALWRCCWSNITHPLVGMNRVIMGSLLTFLWGMTWGMYCSSSWARRLPFSSSWNSTLGFRSLDAHHVGIKRCSKATHRGDTQLHVMMERSGSEEPVRVWTSGFTFTIWYPVLTRNDIWRVIIIRFDLVAHDRYIVIQPHATIKFKHRQFTNEFNESELGSLILQIHIIYKDVNRYIYIYIYQIRSKTLSTQFI